jgi:hypothetical protein
MDGAITRGVRATVREPERFPAPGLGRLQRADADDEIPANHVVDLHDDARCGKMGAT